MSDNENNDIMNKLVVRLDRILIWPKAVDRIIKLVNKVSIWNGVNYNHEFMFKLNGEWVKPEQNPVIQLGFGEYVSGYGDWGGGFTHSRDDIIKVWVDKDLVVKDKLFNGPFYNGPDIEKSLKRKLRRQFDKIKIGKKLPVKNEMILAALRDLFDLPVEQRYKETKKLSLSMKGSVK